MKAILIYIDKECSNVITYNTGDNLEKLVLKLISKFCDVYAYKKSSNNNIHISTKDGRMLNVKWKHIALWEKNNLFN